MKKISFSSLFYTLLAIIAIGAMSSCSKSGDILNYASNDDIFTMSGDFKTILENANCKITNDGIQVSESLETILRQMMYRDADDLLEVKGVDFDFALFTVTKDHNPVIAFGLTDPDAFVKYLEDINDEIDPDKEKDVTILLQDRRSAFFIKGNVACFMYDDEGREVDAKYINKYLDRASSHELAGWQKSALEEGNCINGYLNYGALLKNFDEMGVGMAQLKKFAVGYDADVLAKSYMKFASTLEGLEYKVVCQMVDNDGKVLKSNIELAKPNMDMLKYASSDDVAVAIAGMPKGFNWDEYLNNIAEAMNPYGMSDSDKETFKYISTVLDNIDGTVMMAGGPVNAHEIDSPNGWHAVLAVEMKEGAAEKYIAQLKNLIDENNKQNAEFASEYDLEAGNMLNYTYQNGVLSFVVPGESAEITVNADGNVFVATLGQSRTRGACLIGANDFDGALGGLVISLPKENVFSEFTKFPFGVNLKMLYAQDKATLVLEETETDGLLLDNIFNFAAGQF